MRIISREFIEDLKTGVLSELTALVKNSNELVLCFRENYINVYYKCHSMFKITELTRDNRYKVDFDIMYLRYMDEKQKRDVLSELKIEYDIQSNNDYLRFYIDKSGEIYEWFNCISNYYREFMDEWFAGNEKEHLEKDVQQQIFIKQSRNTNCLDGYLYYDLEFALPNHHEYGRVDLLGVKFEEGMIKDLVFAELKSNKAACDGGTSDISSHLEKYAGMMDKDYDFYSDMCFAMNTYKELGIINCDVEISKKVSKRILLLFSDDAIKWMSANENNLPKKVHNYSVDIDTVCLRERSELHLHTTMSAMDGVSTITDYINAAIYDKMPAVAITDHASVQSFPEAYNTMKKYRSMGLNLKIIYGNEVYVADDKSKDNKENRTHATVLVLNKTGLKNLYKLVSLAILNTFTKFLLLPKVNL